MTRTRRAILGLACLFVLLVAGSIILVLTADEDQPAVSASSGSPPPSAGGDAARPVRPEVISWVFDPMPLMGIGQDSFVLQAGTLGEEEPLLDLDVRWEADLDADLTRRPAVGPPLQNSVVYVEDDGAMSIIHRAVIARDGADMALAELRDVVWDIAVAPDNTVAYAALTDRETRENDRGVVRIRLDGSGVIEQAMPPAEIADVGDIVPAAFISFNVQLMISDDGRHLARRACAGSHGCLIEVVDLASGAISPVPDGELNGMAAGFMVLTRCTGAGCRPHAVDLETGVSLELATDAPVHVISVDGQPMVVTTSSDPHLGTSIDAIDIMSGDRRVLFRAERGSWGSLGLALDLTLAVPAGHVHVTHSTELPDQGGAVVEMRHRELLIALRDGQITEIPSAPIRPIPGFNHQG